MSKLEQANAYINVQLALLDMTPPIPAEKREIVLRNLGEVVVMMAEEE